MSGATLKSWRHRLGLTQKEAAEQLGIPALTLSAWETGRICIKRPRMLQLALQALESETRKADVLHCANDPNVETTRR